jgi:TatD DNase family protein
VIDSHCHLADAAFAGDLDAVIARARGAGLERVLTVLSAGDTEEIERGAAVAERWPDVRFGIGVHPHTAGTFAGRAAAAADVVREQIRATPAARAVGETGLDYHYDLAPRLVQQDVFRAQVSLAREMELPVIVHTRDADADTIEVLQRAGDGRVRGVLHCFTGSSRLAAAALELGFYVSFAGIVTFPRAEALRDTARAVVPLDRLLVETDSPFLAPVPHRGTRNEPARMTHVVAALAAVHGTSAEHIAEHTTANFRVLFRP